MYLTRCPQSLLLAFFFFYLCGSFYVGRGCCFFSLPFSLSSSSLLLSFCWTVTISPTTSILDPKDHKKMLGGQTSDRLLDWLYLDLQYMLLAWNHLVPRFLNPQHSCDWLTKYPFSLTKKNPSAHSPATQPHSTGIFLGIELEVTMRHRQT